MFFLILVFCYLSFWLACFTVTQVRHIGVIIMLSQSKVTVLTNFPYTSYSSGLLTYLLTPWCRVLLEKLTGLQILKKFPAFRGTRRFITALTSVRHLSLSWASPIQSIYPHPTSWRSFLILSTLLRLGLPIGLLHYGFPTKTLYTPLSSPICATCPAHLILAYSYKNFHYLFVAVCRLCPAYFCRIQWNCFHYSAVVDVTGFICCRITLEKRETDVSAEELGISDLQYG